MENLECLSKDLKGKIAALINGEPPKRAPTDSPPSSSSSSSSRSRCTSDGVIKCPIREYNVLVICNRIQQSISYITQGEDDFDISQLSIVEFLTMTLPKLVEVLVKRRTTKRHHEKYVVETLLVVIRFLALPACQECAELCELRNILLTERLYASSFILVTQDDLSLTFSSDNYNGINYGDNDKEKEGICLFADGGKPVSLISSSGKMVCFWPDQWQSVLGGKQCIGQWVSMYITYDVEKNAKWTKGEIKDFDTVEKMYIIEIFKESADATSDNPIGEKVSNEVAENVAEVQPVDLKEKVISYASEKIEKDEMKDLKEKDVDEQLSIEGDENDFITVSTRVDLPVNNCIKIDLGNENTVFQWIEKYNESNYSSSSSYGSPTTNSSSITRSRSDLSVPEGIGDGDAHVCIVKRPDSALSRQQSFYPNLVFNEFHKNDGFRTMFRTINFTACDSSPIHDFLDSEENGVEVPHSVSTLPTASSRAQMCICFRTILLHLQLLQNLRYIIPHDVMTELVWEAKESIPFALLKFKEEQLKKVRKQDIVEMFSMFKELIVSVYDKEVKSNSKVAIPTKDLSIQQILDHLEESIEFLYLDFCRRLLEASSMITQKLLGLMLIMDKTEVIMPRVKNFLVTKNVTPNPSHFGRGNMLFTRTHLTPTLLERWVTKNDLIDVLFGESFHPDLASRADVIIIFMALRGVLTLDHLQSIWSTALTSHEAVSRSLHDLILRIVPVLSPHLRVQFFNIISMPSPQRSQSRSTDDLESAVQETTNTSGVLKNFYYYPDQTLHLIKKYTVVAHKTFIEESVNSKNINGNSGSLSSASMSSLEGTNLTGGFSHNQKKGQVVNAPQRQWLGFGVLWQLIQDPEKSSLDNNTDSNKIKAGVLSRQQIDLVISLLLELLTHEFVEEREIVLQRCLGNIQIGVSVAVSMKLSRKILETFPAAPRSWFSYLGSYASSSSGSSANLTIGVVLEKLQKYCRLLDVICIDLERLQLITKTLVSSLPDATSINNARVESSGHVSIVPLLPSIHERLHFLTFILQHTPESSSSSAYSYTSSSTSSAKSKLSLKQICFLWDFLADGAPTPEVFHCFISFLVNLLEMENPEVTSVIECFTRNSTQEYKSGSVHATNEETENQGQPQTRTFLFETGVLGTFFERIIGNWCLKEASLEIMNTPIVANFFFRLFFLVNMDPGKYFVDGRSMSKIPVGTLVRESGTSIYSTGELVGIGLLWHMATKLSNKTITEVAAKILIDLHISESVLGDSTSNGGTFMKSSSVIAASVASERKRAFFLERCFDELSLSVSTLRHRASSSNENGTGNDPRLNFKESSKSSIVLSPVEQVARYVFLMRSFVEKLGEGVNVHPPEENRRHVKARDEVDSGILSPTRSCTKNTSNSQKISLENIELSDNLDDSIDCFAETLSILGIFAREKNQSLFVIDPPEFPLTDLLDKGGVTSLRGAKRKIIDELLENYLKAHPKNQDQLLDILDGYLINDERGAWTGTMSVPSSVDNDKKSKEDDKYYNHSSEHSMMQHFSSDVWHVLQSLPPHPRIYAKLKELGGTATQSPATVDTDGTLSPTPASFRALFDITQPFRLLYTLQIVDSLLSCEAMHNYSSRSSRKNTRQIVSDISRINRVALSWTLEFIGIGGPEYIVDLLYKLCETRRNYETAKPNLQLDSKRRQLPCNVDRDGVLKVMMRSDVPMLSIAILLRILHKLLLVDPMYVVTSYDDDYSSSHLSTCTTSDLGKSSFGGSRLFRRSRGKERHETSPPSVSNYLTSSTVPPGLVMSFIDLPKLIEVVLEVSCHYLEAVMESTTQSCSDAACLQALCQHVILLVFGLSSVSMRSGGTSIENVSISKVDAPKDNNLESGLQMTRQFLTMVCVNVPCTSLRTASCRQLLHSLVSIIEQSDSIEASNSILDYWFDFFVSLLPIDRISTQHDQLSALVGSIIYLRSNKNTQNLLPHFASRLMLVHPIPSTSSDFAVDIETDGSLYSSSKPTSRSMLFMDGDDSAAGCLCVVASLIATNDVLIDDKIFFPLIEFIFQKCLLPSTKSNNDDFVVPLCRSTVARRLAFRTLLALCQHKSSNMTYLLKCMRASDRQLGKDQNSSLWDYDPTAFMKRQKFVGLTNQGATCYMNSFLQQLFLTKQFTDKFLSIEDKEPPQYKDSDSHQSYQRQGGEVIIYQLKKLLGSLSMSSKAFYDTITFCRSLRDFDGNSINLTEQKDMVEFANSLFDTLESDERYKALLSSVFQGKLVYTIESTECDYRSEREEPFYIITAEVKNKPSLETSFQLFVEPELLSGDNKIKIDATEKEPARKVEANRRCSFRELPNVLIVHLKRFDFDLETLNMKKLNDAFAFPRVLDMYPYCEDGLSSSNQFGAKDPDDNNECIDRVKKRNESYYKYNLKGIVAHMGAINSGHYYSFIKHDSEVGDTQDTWSEFNDSRVSPFNPDLISAECFGGAQDKHGNLITSVSNAYDPGSTQPQAVPYRQHNAYMLVYERMADITQNGSSCQLSAQEKPKMCDKLYKELLDTNMIILRDRLIISKMYFQFIWTLLNSCSPTKQEGNDVTVECRSELVLTVLKFTLEVGTRSKAEESVLTFLNVAEKIIMHDELGLIAERILEELGVHDESKQMEMESDSSGKVSVQGMDNGNECDYSKALQDQCHPWIREMLVFCPHNVYMHSFYRLIFKCVDKVIKDGYSLRADVQKKEAKVCTITESREKEEIRGAAAPEFNDSPVIAFKFLSDTFDPSQLIKETILPSIQSEYRTKCVDVTLNCRMTSLYNLFNQLLILMESMCRCDMSHSEGFAICTTLLQQIMAVGYMQRLLVIQIRGVPRVLALFLKMSTYSGQHENISCILSALLDLLVTLLTSCIIVRDKENCGSILTLSQSKISPYIDKSMKNGIEAVGALLVLSQADLSCVMNKVFLVEAIRVDSSLMSKVLSHICWSRDETDCFEILEFLAETSKEYLLSNPEKDILSPPPQAKMGFGDGYFTGRDKGTSVSDNRVQTYGGRYTTEGSESKYPVDGRKDSSKLSFRPYLEVYSDLLIQKASCDPTTAIYETTIQILFLTMDISIGRRYVGGDEFASSIILLLEKLRGLDAKNNMRVCRLIDEWDGVCRNYLLECANNRGKNLPLPYSMVPTSDSHGANSHSKYPEPPRYSLGGSGCDTYNDDQQQNNNKGSSSSYYSRALAYAGGSFSPDLS